jgi:hypothetical protein
VIIVVDELLEEGVSVGMVERTADGQCRAFARGRWPR